MNPNMDYDVFEDLLWNSTSSSSSSEEDDEIQITEGLIEMEILIHHPKNEEYAEITLELYNAQDFQQHFKITKQTVQALSERYEQSPYFPTKDTGFPRISGFKTISIFIWFSSHEAAGYRDVSDRFDISIATLHFIIENVSLFLSSMSQDIIQWPSTVEQHAIERQFCDLGFPGCIGCIDGTHIQIDKPAQDSESYLNRKKFYSIQVQAVCDADRKIRDVFIGYPGSVHDARVFRNSTIYGSLPNKCGEYFLVGDSAYPCLRNLMTPYKDNGRLTGRQKNFNEKLSKARIKIEHTFGGLKQKWRQLYHLKLKRIQTICHFIRACCVLYNLTQDDELLELPVLDPANELEPDENADIQNRGGQEYRNYLTELLDFM